MKTRLTTTKANGKAPICSACKYLLRQHLITFMTGKIFRYLSSKYVREMRMRLLSIYLLVRNISNSQIISGSLPTSII